MNFKNILELTNEVLKNDFVIQQSLNDLYRTLEAVRDDNRVISYEEINRALYITLMIIEECSNRGYEIGYSNAVSESIRIHKKTASTDKQATDKADL